MHEAVLETREGERYIGFLIEAQPEDQEWEEIYGDLVDEPDGLFMWRITDRLTGSVTEGPIDTKDLAEVWRLWDETWELYNGAMGPKLKQPSEYQHHPNFGRF
jgi:hypothetical protein